MDQKLVSVLIPVYNVESYIKESIESILNQTYRNLEIIIIDDGSTDNTFRILRSIADSDRRVKLFKNDKNLKIVKTLNRALSLSSGEYIARMDGDDISAPDRIEKKVTFLNSNPDYCLVGCSLTTIDSNGNILGKSTKPSNFDFIKSSIKYVSPVSHIWVARKEIYDELGGYRELSGAEDYDFLLRLLSSNKKFTNISDYYGYFVRLGREGNTVDAYGLKQRKLHYLIYKYYKQRLKYGADTFNNKTSIQTYKLSNEVFKLASKLHQKSLSSYSKKHYLKTIFYLLSSCISPYMIHYYYYSFCYKILQRNFERRNEY